MTTKPTTGEDVFRRMTKGLQGVSAKGPCADLLAQEMGNAVHNLQCHIDRVKVRVLDSEGIGKEGMQDALDEIESARAAMDVIRQVCAQVLRAKKPLSRWQSGRTPEGFSEKTKMNFFQAWAELPALHIFRTPIGPIEMWPQLTGNGSRLNLSYTDGEHTVTIYERIEDDAELSGFISQAAKALEEEKVWMLDKGQNLAFSEMCRKLHDVNVKNGFYEGDVNIGERLALVHSEVSEALECDRKGMFTDPSGTYVAEMSEISDDSSFKVAFQRHVKDTFEDELADIVIRVMDLAEYKGIDLWAHIKAKVRYNSLRPYKHGKKY